MREKVGLDNYASIIWGIIGIEKHKRNYAEIIGNNL